MVLAAARTDLVAAALERRAALLVELHAEGTDCYRLFHGIAEGHPGLTIDRYGGLLLLQTFRAPLPHDEVERLAEVVQRRLPVPLAVVCNHRGEAPGPLHREHVPLPPALGEHRCREQGDEFVIAARHPGQDPWLFLDLRAGRRLVRTLARGKRVLNLFAYTCGVGVAAGRAGAAHVLNVDFARSALAVGARNAAVNGLCDDRFATLPSDCIPVLRQLAGLPVQRRRQRRPFAALAPQPFDLVFLDPPRWAKGPFGAIDVVRDYASLWKPCVLALAAGGTAIATNHVAEVDADRWLSGLRRSAEKAGRPLQSLECRGPEADFPSLDGRPPLKIAIATVGQPSTGRDSGSLPGGPAAG